MEAISSETKYLAQYALRQAVRKGALIRPDKCSRCDNSKQSGHVIMGHHPDYNQPLKIEWLCRQCHEKEHQRLRWENGLVKAGQIILNGKNYKLPCLAQDVAINSGLLYEDVAVSAKYYEDQIDWEEVLSNLSGQQWNVVVLSFGIYGRREHTLREIGKRLGISGEMVRQVQNKAIERLRFYL